MIKGRACRTGDKFKDMQYTILQLCLMFVIYSFLGWVIGVAVGAVKNKHFANTGFMIMPICPSYGFGALLVSVFLSELGNKYIFLFIGGAVLGALVCVTTGVFLEHILHKKWWDYSKGRFQFEGYLKIWHLAIFGLSAIFIIKLGNPFIIYVTKWIPVFILKIIAAVCLGLILLDILLNGVTLFQWRLQLSRIQPIEAQMENTTKRLGNYITSSVRKRILKAYPLLNIKSSFKKKEKSCFASGCCFYKLFWLFVIAAFLGDIIETIFCRVTMGVWMSRSSLVFGSFSVVWGLGCAAFTAFLYKHKDRPVWVIFLEGTILGGVYEYVCSVFTELVFGTVFWDYSKIPFNLGGRINLLYCLFWGVAAIIWFKVIYPFLSGLIEKPPVKPATIVTWICVFLMAGDMIISAAALSRYSTRQQGVEAANSVEAFLDVHFDDEFMYNVYPKAKLVENQDK